MCLCETERLIIRPFKKSDISSYSQIISDPSVMKYIGNGKPQTYSQAESYIIKNIEHYESFGWSRFAVVESKSDTLIGFCGYSYYNNEIDFGWRYAKKYWKKGYGTEAALAVLDIGLNKFNFSRIVCISFPMNIGSIKIIKKLGFKFEKNINLEGNKLEQYVYE
jgi:RimJ/RimL family protein N-acetyltransferase